ncbi:hypothetical protein QA802_07785 [Streptomyces sp. B21-105]|uniref:hypothetical protein n=1 Tax=Streptomyces sp. B21-105 TaxID=3039417 RepID=UPI002FF422CA
MGIRSFARSLRPGNDQQLADNLSQQRRRTHRQSATRADRAGQNWDAKDRDAERNRSGRYSR